MKIIVRCGYILEYILGVRCNKDYQHKISSYNKKVRKNLNYFVVLTDKFYGLLLSICTGYQN
jgi:hypothetical protein